MSEARTIARNRTARQPLAVAILHMAVTSCGSSCPPHGYDEGERFRITILGHPPDKPGDCGHLEVGQSFVLTAGPWVETALCDKSGAVGPPPFAADLVPRCKPRIVQLGMECDGRSGFGECGPAMQFGIGPKITREDRVIEDALLGLGWTYPGCGECTEAFTVRIEALDRM